MHTPSHRTGIICGASSLLGITLTQELGKLGDKMTVMARTSDDLPGVMQDFKESGGRFEFSKCDVRNRDEVEQAFADHIRIHNSLDYLILNLSPSSCVPFEKMSANTLDIALDTAIKGSFYCLQEALPFLKTSKSPRVVVMGGAFVEQSAALGAHLGVIKAGLLSLVRSLAVEWAPYRISVNMVSPGPIAEAKLRRVLPSEGLRRQIADKTPLKRFVQAKEVSDLIAYLLSESGGMITGQNLVIDGGLSLVYPGLIPQGLDRPEDPRDLFVFEPPPLEV